MNHIAVYSRAVSRFKGKEKCFLGQWDSFAVVPLVATKENQHTAILPDI